MQTATGRLDKPRRHNVLTPLLEVKRLEQDNPAPPDVIEKAKQLVQDVISRKLPLSQSIIASVLMSGVRRVFTTTVPTLAVQLAGDGFPLLLVNPQFACDLREEGLQFVCTHEAYHLLMMHLLLDPMLKTNQNFTTAEEACINYRVQKLLNTSQLPTIEDRSAKARAANAGAPAMVETGVNPQKVFAEYKKALKDADLTPVEKIEDFYATDLGCFAELERMPHPPRSAKNEFCIHVQVNGAGGEANQPVLDHDEVSRVVGQALAAVMHEATANGNKTAKAEVLALMQATGESERASKIWGDLGAASLRGETTVTRKTDAWERWTADCIATTLADGSRLRYAKKLWWDRRVTAHGKQPRKHGVVAVDASGSMHTQVLDAVAAIIGETPNLDVTWVSFDGAVYPFEPGQAFLGGGGTNCQLVDHWIDENLDEAPDFVLVVTDGIFSHFTPRDPEAWIWLITRDGDAWPETWNPPMACRQLEIDAQGVVG